MRCDDQPDGSYQRALAKVNELESESEYLNPLFPLAAVSGRPAHVLHNGTGGYSMELISRQCISQPHRLGLFHSVNRRGYRGQSTKAWHPLLSGGQPTIYLTLVRAIRVPDASWSLKLFHNMPFYGSGRFRIFVSFSRSGRSCQTRANRVLRRHRGVSLLRALQMHQPGTCCLPPELYELKPTQNSEQAS